MQDEATPLKIELGPLGSGAEIHCARISGFLDAHTVKEFEREMGRLLRANRVRLILDLTALTYTSSAGIGALMRLAQDLSARDGDLVLLNPSERVLEVLELFDFTRIFKLARSADEACALLRGEEH